MCLAVLTGWLEAGWAWAGISQCSPDMGQGSPGWVPAGAVLAGWLVSKACNLGSFRIGKRLGPYLQGNRGRGAWSRGPWGCANGVGSGGGVQSWVLLAWFWTGVVLVEWLGVEGLGLGDSGWVLGLLAG